MWSTRWEHLHSWAPPQILVWKCTNHNRLVTMHLEYVNYPMFLINHIYAKNSLRNWEYSNVKMNTWCEHKDLFQKNIKKHFQFYQINIFEVHAKSALKWKLLIGINTLTWAPNTIETWPLPTWTYFYTIYSSTNCMARVSIYRYPCWLDVYSYFNYGWMSQVDLT